MDEFEYANKLKKEALNFNLRETVKGIEFVDFITLKNVKFNFNTTKMRETNCYLYNTVAMGFNEFELAEKFEGKNLVLYRNISKRVSKQIKCMWCGEKPEDVIKHINKRHNKDINNIVYRKFQQNIYKELLRILRGTEFYFATPFINVGCQTCIKPQDNKKCHIQTTTRDRMRSLFLFGLEADNLDQNWLIEKDLGQILLAP